jgi:Tfp pilus assembly protein FimT
MAGITLSELVVTASLIVTMAAVAIPTMMSGLDHWRVRGAASFMASRFALTRMEAVHHNANVGLRFEVEDSAFRMRPYADGNNNGVRAADIRSGVDAPVLPAARLDQLFPGVQFGFISGATLIDGTSASPGDDPIRFGVTDMCTFSPLGTSTPGTVYLRDRHGTWQFAVVVLGATGRTRILQFDRSSRRWIAPW